MAIFYTSDLHFHHNNICKFTERSKVTNAQLHTNWLINVWNTQVQPGDTVYHLGDFSFAKTYQDYAEVLSQLHGQVFLIQGNHDNSQYLKRLVQDNYAVWQGTYKEVSIDSTKVCLFHYPISAWNKQHYGSYHLFGHCHSSFTNVRGKALDVGLDNAYKLFGQHRFFTEQDIRDYMNTKKLFIADHHTKR